MTEADKRIKDLESALRAFMIIADGELWGERPGDHPMRGAARDHAHRLLDEPEEENESE